MIQRFLDKIGVSDGASPEMHGAKHPISVDRLHFLIGDVHGRADLLDRCIDRIREIYDATLDADTARVVFLGDYIDRGENSAAVLQTLWDLTTDGDTVCLQGNHEKMMLDFVQNPERNGRRWLRYGGLQTLASFGVRGAHERMEREDLPDLADAFKAAVPEGLLQWVADMPLMYQNGTLTCVHAGVDPKQGFEDQDAGTLLWGHPEFFKHPHISGETIAFGHTVFDSASYQDGRLALDTGAYATGKLSMGVINKTSVEIVEI